MKFTKAAYNLHNKKFGRLIAIEPVYKDKWKSIVWKCKCDCGNIRFVRATNLVRGVTKSCGCFQKDQSRKMCQERATMEPEESGFSKLFSAYRANARNRNLSFELTREQFRSLNKQNCYYCGVRPLQEQRGGYIYNGLDRLDNSKGYSFDNCVPCCKICNQAKHTLLQEDFLYWIARVYNHQMMQIEYT